MCLLCLKISDSFYCLSPHSEIRQALGSLRKQHLDCLILRRDVILINIRVKGPGTVG